VTDFEKCYNNVKADLLPFESWERLAGESSAAYAAFCVFRDYGAERNIKRAAASVESDTVKQGKRYRMWRLWSTQFQWFKRAADYDVYLDKLKQTERRKTIEQREEAYREVTGKMLQVVNKKLDMMDAQELSQGNVKEWMTAAINTEREVFGLVTNNDGKETQERGEPQLKFGNEFEGM
jgi:hypothetical protein